ncbi:hypothetical protein RUND412_002068 [Rhizina undulata]
MLPSTSQIRAFAISPYHQPYAHSLQLVNQNTIPPNFDYQGAFHQAYVQEFEKYQSFMATYKTNPQFPQLPSLCLSWDGWLARRIKMLEFEKDELIAKIETKLWEKEHSKVIHWLNGIDTDEMPFVDPDLTFDTLVNAETSYDSSPVTTATEPWTPLTAYSEPGKPWFNSYTTPITPPANEILAGKEGNIHLTSAKTINHVEKSGSPIIIDSTTDGEKLSPLLLGGPVLDDREENQSSKNTGSPDHMWSSFDAWVQKHASKSSVLER